MVVDIIARVAMDAITATSYAAVNGSLDPTLSKARQALAAASTPNLHSEKIATK